MKNYLYYFKGTITNPFTTFQDLTLESKKMLYAFLVNLPYAIIGAIYSLMLIIKKIHPYIPTFIKIKLEHYYIIESIYYAPLTFFCLLMTTGFIHFFGTLSNLNKNTNFLSTFSLVNFSIFVPFSLIWLCWDVIMAILILTGILSPEFLYYTYKHFGLIPILNLIAIFLSTLWQVYLIQITIKINYNIINIKGLIISIIAVLSFLIIWLFVFMR